MYIKFKYKKLVVDVDDLVSYTYGIDTLEILLVYCNNKTIEALAEFIFKTKNKPFTISFITKQDETIFKVVSVGNQTIKEILPKIYHCNMAFNISNFKTKLITTGGDF